MKSLSRVLASLLLIHVVAIALFVNGFLLTRIHLDNKSEKDKSICDAPYKKLVWIVIDALRYDFVISDGRYPCRECSHQGNMPALVSVLSHPDAAKAFRYIAEAPTTTTQRLKAMVSGGLPEFFDVSNAFTASSMDEDNLISQLAADNRRMVFMGDATWANLFPSQFNVSLPFPCFNVKDLDSVDDGVWENLLPAIHNAQDWDILVAHYLGVDHAGHSVGVESSKMTKKLRQMDDHVAAVVDSMVSGAGPGGPFEDAVLLVSGDHGQTMNGDHGGGSPEEVDSVLIAVDVAALREARALQAGIEVHGQHKTIVSECRAGCRCGDDGNQCADDLPQVDLVPTVAAMLDVPVPYVNLGRLNPELWSLAGTRCAVDGEVELALERAVAANADQVHTYLNVYAGHKASRFSSKALRRVNNAYHSIPKGKGMHDPQQGFLRLYLDYLSLAGEVARQEWTQFGDVSMIFGIALFFACVVYHARAVWLCISVSVVQPKQGVKWDWAGLVRRGFLPVALWTGVAAQCGGIFSFFYLLSEGTLSGYLVVAMTITLAFGLSVGSTGQKVCLLLSLGAAAVMCNGLAMHMGVATHSGYGFWQRLTVHDPVDAGFEPAGGTVRIESWLEGAGIIRDRHAWSISFMSHLCTQLLPTLALCAVAVGQLSAGAFLQSALLTTLYALLVAHQGVGWLVHAGILPQTGLTVSSAMDQAKVLWPRLSFIVEPIHANYALKPAFILSLHLLLPRGIMAVCAMCFITAAVQGRIVGVQRTVTAFIASLGAFMLLITNTMTPLIALLFIGQATSLFALVRTIGGPTEQKISAALCAAALAASMQTQAFFLTGHLCEFAGLQYTAGFVGYEEFDLVRSGSLVAIDTFGGMAVVTLGLVEVAERLSDQSIKLKRRESSIKGGGGDGLLSAMLLLFGLARSAACFCATLSAGVQRRHLYAWALFAPKFAFEVFFLLMTDIVLFCIAFCMRK